MQNGKIRILAVDDEAANLEILSENLIDAGYEVLCARNGVNAWELLERNPGIMLILLDRMMPEMDGMAFIRQQKTHEKFRHIPVIMQTGAASTEQMKEGIEAGVFYYLTKPYDEALLLAIVEAAINDVRRADATNLELQELHTNLTSLHDGLKNLVGGVFEFRTLDEVRRIAFIVANSCPDPKKTILGISEIMINAVEHGNLGITFEEKSKLLLNGNYEYEIRKRLDAPHNRQKKATVEIKRNGQEMQIIITDTGAGFDWARFMKLSPERATLPNGRGIAMAEMFSFDHLVYVKPGNKVICSIHT